MGDLIAPILVEKLKIKSQNDEKLLAEAKEQSYTLGYYEGVLLVGKYKGEKVEIVKDKIRGELFADKLAVNYSEPEKPVVSRSGDNCVVALVDQWFLVYGEENWKQQALSFSFLSFILLFIIIYFIYLFIYLYLFYILILFIYIR